MIWPFRRKQNRPIVHVGPISTDWCIGDMAECIDGRWRKPKGNDPKKGDRLMVSGVYYGDDGEFASICLGFVGLSHSAYACVAFRKIVLTDTGADRKVAKNRPVEMVPF